MVGPTEDSKARATEPGNSSRPTRLELPGRLMRPAAAVLGVGLLLAVLLGSWRADDDVRAEMTSAMAVAQAVADVQRFAHLADAALIDAMRDTLATTPLRHLHVSLRDAQGALQLSPRRESEQAPWLQALVRLQRHWQAQSDPPPLVVAIPRPDGEVWSLVITPNPDSERRESVQMLAQTTAILAASALLLLALMRWRVLRALRPMRGLLSVIDRLRDGDTAAAAQLPPMPVAELQAIAEALRALAQALAQAEQDRRVLSLRLQSLQEDERRRMAQELHDELGQRLTALRLEASVLQRVLAHQPQAAAAASRLGHQVQAAQAEVTQLLRRLSPRTDHAQPVARLRELLDDLTRALPAGAPGPRVSMQLDLGSGPLSEALLMALFRMSQEALTNARRHSQAEQAWLTIHRQGQDWLWQFEDDGVGLPDPLQAQRAGNGLAGLRERAWAFGGDLVYGSSDGRGLRLQALLRDPLDATTAKAA